MSRSKPKCAFLTMDAETIESHGFASSIYDHLLVEPLTKCGWEVAEPIPWRGHKSFDWSSIDVLIVRSPWDYQDSPEEFVRCIEHMASIKTLTVENSPRSLLWNLSKTYLRDLADASVSTIPTTFAIWEELAVPLSDREAKVAMLISEAIEEFGEIVVKPLVSANSDFTYRVDGASLRSTDATSMYAMEGMRQNKDQPFLDFLTNVFAERDFMMQPFLRDVLSEGELSLFYFNGVLSHATKKVPKKDDFRVQEEHGAEHFLLTPEQVPEELRITSTRALTATPDGPPQYARMDYLRLREPQRIGEESFAFAVMEVEIIEPSLYFDMDDGQAAKCFAEQLTKRHCNLF